MKKFLIFLAFFCGFFAFIRPTFAAETIRDFSVKATLSQDRLLQVTETIQYDFGAEPHHGIYRVIPEAYERNGGSYRLDFKFTRAAMDGQTVSWSVSNPSGNVEVKIGDPGQTITGTHIYTIEYETNKALNDFLDETGTSHAELYWNVTGNDWQIPIEKTSFTLQAPGQPTRTVCYAGLLGSQESTCQIKIEREQTVFTAMRSLAAGEGITIVAAFAPGVIRPLTTVEKVQMFIVDNVWVLVPVVVFVIMFYIWWTHGRDPKGRGTIIAQYEEPRGLAPASMVALMEQNVSTRAITATILDLARRGYLKVVFDTDPATQRENPSVAAVLDFARHRYLEVASGKDQTDRSLPFLTQKPFFHFERKKHADENMEEFEKTLFDGLFASGPSVTVDDLKGKYFQTVDVARAQIFKDLKARGLFGPDPASVRAIWIGLVTVMVLGVFFLADFLTPIIITSVAISAIIILAFGWQMPRRTKEGAMAKEECEGLKLFLSVTEKARLEFTDAPAKRPEQFERFLPDAVAFGVEKEWAKQFEGIDIQPSYMTGPLNTWTTFAMIDAVGHMEVAASTMYQAPSSTAGRGGSGFSGGGSGGGFGGGGGGSW